MRPECLGLRGRDEDEAEVVTALIESIDRYAAEKIDARSIDERHGLPIGMREELAEMGLFSLSIPEQYGGAGLSMQAVCEVVEALAQHDRSVATTVGLHLGLGTRGLVAFGSDALRAALLPDLAEGRNIAAFAATEPGAGSDLTRVSTKVIEEGEQLTLDGTKIFVTNGGFAHIFTLLVPSPGLGGARRGQSLVWVRAEDEGVNVGAEEEKLGLRGSSTITLNLDNVKLDHHRVIGEPGTGSKQAGHVLAWGRTAMASGCVGTCKSALRLAVQHTKIRKQFGKALIELPVVRAQLASMAASTYAAKALVRMTTQVEGSDLIAWSTSAKVFCSRAAWDICDRSIQLHGGSGFIEETGVALMLRDTRVTRIFEGANDVLLTHSGTLEVMAPRTLETVKHPSLQLANQLTEFVAVQVATLRKNHGVRLLRKPRLLHQLGELVVLRDAAITAAWRAEVADTDRATQCAALFLQETQTRMNALAADLSDTDLVDGVVDALLWEA